MFAKLKFVLINLPVSTVTHLKTAITTHGGDVEYLVNPKVSFYIHSNYPNLNLRSKSLVFEIHRRSEY